MKKVLMIVGSLRKDSYNRQLAARVEEMLKDKAQVSFLEFADLPFMNQDLESPVPERVAAVRQAVLDADGIWIFSPEYNYQIPGVLKNLLDWLSRPMIPGDRDSGTAARGKTVTISGVAGKSGASEVRRHLSVLLEVMSMNLVAGMGTGISLNAEMFISGRLELSEENLAALKNQMDTFLNAI